LKYIIFDTSGGEIKGDFDSFSIFLSSSLFDKGRFGFRSLSKSSSMFSVSFVF
jgi:hypothetical protein